MIWTKAQNEYLEKLCNERGLNVIRLNEKRKHLETQLYKEKQELLSDYEFELEQDYNEKHQELEREFDYRYNELDKAVEEHYIEKTAIKNLDFDTLQKIQQEELARNQELAFLRDLKEYCKRIGFKGKSVLEHFEIKRRNRFKQQNRDDDDFTR